VHYATELLGAPRHLGIHPGGMVLCSRPIVDVVPVEWAAMADRTVLQWDKDSCAAAGLVKFDLLGLGMLSALRYAHAFLGGQLDLGSLNCTDPEVYEMFSRADTVGVFQIESRAQQSTLPRLQPREFYDLVVEVALIRPGPIQGGAVHPYIARRNGREPVAYAHPLLRGCLEKTLGVLLFQEQCMQVSIDLAGFTAAEADQLRQAMGAKRSAAKMARLRQRFLDGAGDRGVPLDVAEHIFTQVQAFSSYGFPESHAMSFAYLVYASGWLKRYHPAVFTAALLAAQPMGFYSPQSLVDDARRHGVRVLRPCINASQAKASIHTSPDTVWGSAPGIPPERWGLGGPDIRLGLDQVRGLATDVAERITSERDLHGPYTSMSDVARRCELSVHQLECLATADAFACFGLDRRAALWGAGAAAQDKPERLPGTITGMDAPTLPGMDQVDHLMADVWATGLSPDSHPIAVVREHLQACEAIPISALRATPTGTTVRIGGLVTHRQRPGTAKGTVFMSLEDETGQANIVLSPGAWIRWKAIAKINPALIVRGRVEAHQGVVNVVAHSIQPLALTVRPAASRDFR
jgi:error-prone DNA polymerase